MPIKDYLIENQGIYLINDHFKIEHGKFPALSLTLNRFTSLKRFGSLEEIQFSDVIGRKFRDSFEILIYSVFIQRETMNSSICLKLKSAIVYVDFPCIRDRMLCLRRNSGRTTNN